MTGLPMTAFLDYQSATGPTQTRKPSNIRNAASERTYWINRFMNSGRGNKKILRGGKYIETKAFFQDSQVGGFYQPGEKDEFENPQRLKTIRQHWRYLRVHKTWVEQEYLHNEVVRTNDMDAVYHQFASMRAEKDAMMWNRKWYLMEDSVWAVPNRLTMEGEGSAITQPHSLMAFNNEFTNGMWGSGESLTGEWTSGTHTLLNIDPAAADVNGNFSPQQVGYDSIAQDNVGNPVAAMDRMWMKVGFEKPPTHKEYFENEKYNKCLITTSLAGRSLFQQLLRGGNDRLVAGPQDPAYSDPQFHGVPVTFVDMLQSRAYYDNGSGTTATEDVAASGANGSGPRYQFWNTDSVYPVFHEDRYFHHRPISNDHNVQDTFVQTVVTWFNFHCEDRRTLGTIYPTGDLSDANVASLYN